MIDFIDSFQYRFRFIMGSALIGASLLLLSFLPRLFWIEPTVQAADHHSVASAENTMTNDSPNAITRGMFKSADGLDRATSSVEQSVSNSLRLAANSVSSAAAASGQFVAHSVVSAASASADAAVSSVSFVAQGTSNIVGSIADTSAIGAIIRPADTDKTPAPVIDEQLSTLFPTTATAAPAESIHQTAPPNVSGTAWPIPGYITARFGVPHWPYQKTHTGIDVSSGQRSGVTPIKPFKAGRIVNIVRSNAGLGNHVVVDHGEGLTSLYAHLFSISVRVGDQVNTGTVLGHEGSTGASTGTHLHFEIRLNGEPVDPHLYIIGQP